jgi:sensor histidine kinase YesM
MFFSLELLIVLALGLWALTILVLVVKENSKEYLKQQKEIANQRANILMLQMRPHFIYNTMTSIYHLCEQDPLKAKQVTFDFTTYLRKNFAAIASDETVSFTDELEHTRAYLAVEQAQFEDNLFVDFDTPHTLFRVPPLTLQPIVENAVKHGVLQKLEGGTINIKTYETEEANIVEISDDGIGFDTKDPSFYKGNHIGINNIRYRLSTMCHGEMNIDSVVDKGTTVTVKFYK